jgi:hypothetical protein
MQKPAHLGSLATRLNLLEQKFDDGGSGGDDSGLYDLVLKGSEFGGVADGPTIYEHYGSSFFKATFGTTDGKPSTGALVTAQYNSFYDQVLGGFAGGYFVDVGGGLNPDGDPVVSFADATWKGLPPSALNGYSLAYLVTGAAGSYSGALGLDGLSGKSLPDLTFGTPESAEILATEHGDLLSYVKSLETRIAVLESMI